MKLGRYRICRIGGSCTQDQQQDEQLACNIVIRVRNLQLALGSKEYQSTVACERVYLYPISSFPFPISQHNQPLIYPPGNHLPPPLRILPTKGKNKPTFRFTFRLANYRYHFPMVTYLVLVAYCWKLSICKQCFLGGI